MLLFPDTVVATVFSSEYERIFASTLVSTAQRKLCCEMFPIGCFFSRLYLDVSLIQCSRFFKRTYVDKNTDLIRTYYFCKYRPNTDPILAQLKKIQTLAALHSVHCCRQRESVPGDTLLLFCLLFVLI